MLHLIALDFDYQNQPLLNNVTLHVPEGGLLHLKGANGVGKTTLLKLIAGLYEPLEGRVLYQGQSIYEDLKAYQRNVCFVGHKTGINPQLSLKENCFFDLQNDETHQSIKELSSIFKLEQYQDYPAGLLSAGQRRQIGLLRLWMTSARLWLLDEPFVALDEGALAIIMDKIQQHRAKGGAVLLTSHQKIPLDNSKYQEYLL